MCSFCNPVIVERQRFYEGRDIDALIDYRPISDGHCLIIPKRHVNSLGELTPEEWAEVGRVTQKVHNAACKIFGESDYLILQKNGESAGQTVPHVHFHYVRATTGIQTFWFLRFFFTWLLSPLTIEQQESLRGQLAKACADAEIVD